MNRRVRAAPELAAQPLRRRSPCCDLHEIFFQCPSCGQDLKQSIGLLKQSRHMTCAGCGIGINIDADRLSVASEEIQKALDKVPPEITIEFFC